MSHAAGIAALRRFSWPGIVACVLAGLTGYPGAAVEPMPCPDDGTIANGTYLNGYFDLSYPLPSGWQQGLPGPGPSDHGYYVLTTLIPTGDLKGTILIAAQDLFFAPKEPADTAQSAHEFATSIAQVAGMTIDRPPSEVSIAGRRFSRVDFSGVGLFRSTFFTRSRCHLVSFNLTTNDRALLETLAGSLDRIGPARNADSASADPMCVKDYARSNNLVAKVDPAPADPRFASIPVRMVIAADGSVKNVHVIRATAKQRDNIENALGHWKFRPGEADGRGAEIETGLLIEFNAGGTVTYSDDERQASNQRGAGKM